MTILLGTMDGGEKPIIHFYNDQGKATDKYWAENGLIHNERLFDGSGAYQSFTIKGFLERLMALSDAVGNTVRGRGSRIQNAGFYGHAGKDVARIQRFVEEGVALAKIAQRQGDPMDPRASKQKTEERRRRSVVVPSVVDSGW